MRHAETLFLVHNQQAEVLELHIGRNHAVRADDHVGFTTLQRAQNLLLLFRCTEAGQHLHLDREVTHA